MQTSVTTPEIRLQQAKQRLSDALAKVQHAIETKQESHERERHERNQLIQELSIYISGIENILNQKACEDHAQN